MKRKHYGVRYVILRLSCFLSALNIETNAGVFLSANFSLRHLAT
jgi:hypothetical protein